MLPWYSSLQASYYCGGPSAHGCGAEEDFGEEAGQEKERGRRVLADEVSKLFVQRRITSTSTVSSHQWIFLRVPSSLYYEYLPG